MRVEEKGISIIVCCYNSVGRIEKTLEHISAQQVPENIPWEIIVVDNSSTDATSIIADKILQDGENYHRSRVLLEPIPGLSSARKKGVEAARYSFIVLCDDDNWLTPGYGARVYELFESLPELGVIGGRGIGVYEVEPPAWLKRMEKTYAIGPQAAATGAQKSVWGAGMGLRKAAYIDLISLNFKHLNTDRLKNKLTGGGDTEICLALGRMGYVVWYDENLLFKHFVPVERINLEYAKRLCYFVGYASPSFNVYFDAFNGTDSGSWQNHWMFKVTKCLLQLVSLEFRPSNSNYYKDPKNFLKLFFTESKKGEITRLLEMRGKYHTICQQIKNAAWNLK